MHMTHTQHLMTPTAQDLIAAGDPKAALQLLQKQVREHAADAKLRVFLFQLLCVLGQWQRAMTQLEVCGELDPGALAMVNTYREALKCEAVREAVFAGQTTPIVFGQPQPWVAWLVQALRADAQGDAAGAADLRAQAFEAAPPVPGSLNGEPFEWIADADSRLGPVLEAVLNGRYCWVPLSTLRRLTLEAPTDLRDLVWAPAQLEFANGGASVALIPSRYPGSAAAVDGGLQLASRTEWLLLSGQHFRGLGQRVLTTSSAEVGLLDVRELALQASPESRI
jgi:type VI secretion system protein ImpE